MTISQAEYEKKNAWLASWDERIVRLESQLELLMEALRLARHKQFGVSSEKADESFMEQLSFLFNEAEIFAEVKAEADSAVVVTAHKRHKKQEYTLSPEV